MVAPMAHALRNAGRFGYTQMPSDQQQNASLAMLPSRHAPTPVADGVEALGAKAGEGLFAASFGVGAAGFFGRHTLGRLHKPFGANVGRVTSATFDALDSIATKDLFAKGGWNQLKANYYKLASDYVSEHAAGPKSLVGTVKGWFGHQVPLTGAHIEKNKTTAARLLAKSEALGGAKMANAEWQGIRKLGSHMMHRGAFSTIMATGLALASSVALYRAGKEANDDFADFQAVAENLTGEKVTRDTFFRHPEKLSPMLRTMRDNIIDHLKVDAVGAGAKVIENTAFAAMGGPLAHAGAGMFGAPMAGMMGGMMLGSAAQEFKPQQDFVHSYLQVMDLQAAHQPVPEELYADLMEAASAEVRLRGGKQSEQVQRIAQQYASEQLSPAALVKEIYAGEPFKARAKLVFEQMEAERGADIDTDAAQMQAPENAAVSPMQMHSDKPEKASLASAAHMGKMVAEKALEVGGRA